MNSADPGKLHPVAARWLTALVIGVVALYALWYSFVRIHKTLRTSPAMEVGIESRLWSMEDIARLIERQENLRSGALLVG